MQDMENNTGSISVLIPSYLHASFLANKKVAHFRYCRPVGRLRLLTGLLRVALRIEFEHLVVFWLIHVSTID